MHLWSSFSLVLLVLLINFDSSDNATIYCKNDKQCTVTHRICALCIPNEYPSCTSTICIDNQCGILEPCSLQLNGNCTTDGNCIRNSLCETCDECKGPSCATARCFNNQCALIEPCIIRLQH
jgi:hypothetical protein